MSDFIKIDGSFGEGGGQILRSSLTMSLITGKPFIINNIRAKRKNPGLAPQHLAAINAAKEISGSVVEGAERNSQTLEFIPGEVKAGDYSFQVNTAGAMPLVFQTVALPLCFQKKGSQIDFRGGTHVPWAPSYEYLANVWNKVVTPCGFDFSFNITNAGYYPRGGGAFSVGVSPVNKIAPINFLEREKLESIEVVCVLSSLPDHIAQRELDTANKEIGKIGCKVTPENTIKKYYSPGAGNMLCLFAKFGNCYAGFSVLGKRGKPAEGVGKELVREFRKFYENGSPVEEYLADQLLLPLAFSKKHSQYKVANISQHLITNAHIIQKFLDVQIEISAPEGKEGIVVIG